MTDEEKIRAVTVKLLLQPGARVRARITNGAAYLPWKEGVLQGPDHIPTGRYRVVMDCGPIWFPFPEDIEPL